MYHITLPLLTPRRQLPPLVSPPSLLSVQWKQTSAAHSLARTFAHQIVAYRNCPIYSGKHQKYTMLCLFNMRECLWNLSYDWPFHAPSGEKELMLQGD